MLGQRRRRWTTLKQHWVPSRVFWKPKLQCILVLQSSCNYGRGAGHLPLSSKIEYTYGNDNIHSYIYKLKNIYGFITATIKINFIGIIMVRVIKARIILWMNALRMKLILKVALP